MSAVAFVLVLAIVIGVVVGTKSCSNTPNLDGNEKILTDRPEPKTTQLLSPVDPSNIPADAFEYEYTNTTMVGYYAEVLGTYERVKPVDKDGNEVGVNDEHTAFNNNLTGDRYPKYGSTLSSAVGAGDAKLAARSAIISESSYLCAWGTRGANRGGAQTPDKYTKIDENGYLYQYKNGEWIHSLVKGKGLEEDGTTIKQEDYDDEANYRQLYKHTAAARGMYLEGYSRNGVTYAIDDDAPGVIKQVTTRSRGYSSYSITGLYAPAGEVIKVEISGADMKSTGGISIHIGQPLYNGQANNIWASKNQMNRMPHILTTLNLTKETCTYNESSDTWTGYIGSFVGGPIYIRNKGVTFTTKIYGGLEYLHYILGYTTQEEFDRIKTTSKVPYFDLEVWSYGVLHSGPRYYAEGFSYENLYNAAVLWEKVSSVTTTNGSKQGVVFLYDPFVAAGAAVAFPGRSSVNCPLGWMSQSLNYNTLVSSGSWGNFHEYHHNFQNFGLGSGADGETTNNALNIVSYALFTKISSKRGIGSYGAQGLGGWNNYTSGSWTLQRILNGQINSTNGLAVYATLLHNFGANAFISARGTSGANNYFNKWANITHNDMRYFASLTDKYYNGGSNKYNPSQAVKDANYPLFVPVASVYQTGRSYTYDGKKKYSTTMQPYVISNDPFNIDLSPYSAPGGQYEKGSVVIPGDFEYTIKSITKPARGKLEKIDDFNYKYTPAAGAKTGSTSGQIVVTLEIKAKDENSEWAKYKVENVDLILEFQITQETTKMTLERTTYTYSEAKYSDAVEAYNAGFAGSTNKEVWAHSNPTQNANTDIWFYPDTEENRNKYPEKYIIHDNQIEVIDGKLYFDDDGTYRVYLRGRSNCALYYSHDGKSYSLGAKITADTKVESGKTNAYFRPSAAETYFDVKFDEGKVYVKSGSATDFPQKPVYTIKANNNGEIVNWLYIKEVLIVQTKERSYIGVGMRQWTEPNYTQEIKYYRDAALTQEVSQEDYDEMTTEEQEKLYTKAVYYNSAHQEVPEAEVIAAKSVPPTVAEINGSQPYVNAYRSSYDFPDNTTFQSEYFYLKEHNYNYVGTPKNYSTWDEGVSIVSCNKDPWDNTAKIDNLLKDGQDTFFHSKKGADASKGAMELVLDMGKNISANRITFYGRKSNSSYSANTAHQGLPKNFSLEVSKDGKKFTSAGEYTNGTGAAYSASVNLDDTYEFRYVKITITSTHSNNSHFILSGIMFTEAFSLTGNGDNHISPYNKSIIFRGDWDVEQASTLFGLLYHGKEGCKVTFEFKGTYLAIITSTLQDSSFDVYIDGKKVESMDVAEPTGDYGITYLSQKLSDGKHKVEIRCTGETWIDSFALY